MTATDQHLADAYGLRADSAGGLLPKERYLSSDFAALEQAQLWPKVWQWACLEDQVTRPGSYVEYVIGDQSFLVVRGHDERLRAFRNVCLHRGNRLKSGAGRSREIVCGYHAWSWNLDGSVARIPDQDGFPDLDTSCLGLREVLLDTWAGMVFINPDLQAEPLATYLEPLIDKLAGYHLGDHTCTRSLTMPIPANWKTVVDGFLEVYHLQGVHPQLLRFLDDVNTTYDVWGRHSAMYMPMGVPSPRLEVPDDQVTVDELAKPGSGFHGKLLRQSEHFRESDGRAWMEGASVREALTKVGRAEAVHQDRDYSGLTDAQVVDDHHYFAFPNIIFNIDAGHFIASRIRPHETDAEWCYFDMHVFDWLTDEQKAARPAREHLTLEPGDPTGRVPDQDFTQLPGVQKGMHSAGFTHVRLSAQECRVLAFHEEIDRYVFGGR